MFLKDLNEHRSPRVSGELLGELGPTCPFPDLTPTSQDAAGSPQPLFR